MKRVATLGICYMLLLTVFSVGAVQAADESFAEQFVGSPLLVLAALMIVAALAVLYRRIKK
jgi:hypothetical protein